METGIPLGAIPGGERFQGLAGGLHAVECDRGFQRFLPVPPDQRRRLSGDDLDGARLDAELSSPARIKQALHQWRTGVPSSIDDHEVDVVQGTSDGRYPVNLYFDSQTGLLATGTPVPSSDLASVVFVGDLHEAAVEVVGPGMVLAAQHVAPSGLGLDHRPARAQHRTGRNTFVAQPLTSEAIVRGCSPFALFL